MSLSPQSPNIPPRALRLTAALLILFFACILPASAQRAGEEITFPADSYKKLDTFEALNLEDADKLYNKQDYKGAFAAYRAYSFEFPKSKATPYVLLRMGRCLHQLDKRNAAIKSYQDVVDYFPDAVRYAAAALFYIGQCHGQNGDEDKQTAVWAKMVKDDDYVAQPNSGTALTHLGKAMEKLGRFDEAAEYQWRTAVNFLQSNQQAAEAARRSVIHHYAVRKPNHEKLMEFFTAANGFDGRGGKLDKPEENPDYWSTALRTAIGADNEEARAGACSYWTAKLGSRFADDDGLRKLWCDAMLVHEKKPQLWVERMKKQYASKPADVKRALQWCHHFGRDKKLQNAFFMETIHPMLASMANKERIDLMKSLKSSHYNMPEQAQAVMRTVKTQGMADDELLDFANAAADFLSEDEVMRYYARLKDGLLATKARFDYYSIRSHRNQPFTEKALAQIPALRKSPKYASEALSWREAELLQSIGRYEEAIKAYRAANKQPDSTWRITDCLQAMKNYPKAIETVRQLESVGGPTAAQACLRIADIHRAAGDKAREVDQLRMVLKRYPKSGQPQSEAHNRLESYGVALIGGESEAEE